MTDDKLTELCAVAMGWKHLGAVGAPRENAEGKPWCLSNQNDWWEDPEGHWVCQPCCGSVPDPLSNDVHAMALVKKFSLGIDPMAARELGWMVTYYGDDESYRGGVRIDDPSLNRAIVRCVAEMTNAALPEGEKK